MRWLQGTSEHYAVLIQWVPAFRVVQWGLAKVWRQVLYCVFFTRSIAAAGFSVVKMARERATGIEYACKVMVLPPIGANARDHDSTREDIFKEIEILVGLAHENVVYLKEYFEEANKVCAQQCSHIGLTAAVSNAESSLKLLQNCILQLL